VVIQIGDDDKYVFTPDGDIDKIAKLIKNSIKDILGFGFNPERTFVFLNSEYIGEFYHNVCHIEKNIAQKTIKEAFGYTESDSVGMFALPTVKAAAAFATSFPGLFPDVGNDCPALVACGLDQAPIYSLARDVAPNLGQVAPAVLYTQFIPSMQGLRTKMSGGEPHNSLLLTDTAADVKKKINKNAFSGGGVTLEEHKKNGGNTEIDVPF
jgi:tryptophanyl-tRNA synthetase